MKHSYSINSRERQVVYFILAAVAFGVALVIGRLLSLIPWAPPTWIDIPGAFTLFGLLTLWFEKQLWRWSLVRHLGIRTPILDGTWTGVITSSFDGHASEIPVTLTVQQEWTSISFHMATAKSGSDSIGAAVNVDAQGQIIYCYRNRPNADAVLGMHAHDGTAELRITANGLTGDFYSGRDRGTVGTINLQRQHVATKRTI